MYELLLKHEKRLGIEFSNPISVENEKHLMDSFSNVPMALIELLQISDGMEIDKTLITIFSGKEICEYKDIAFGNLITIGLFGFGDFICMDPNGRIIQIDYETGEIFLTWESFSSLLLDKSLECED